MVTFERAGEMLDEIADSLPIELYRELNGGVVLLPEEKLHPQRVDDDLYILGEYCRNSQMGKYIKIYYGSFARLFGHLREEAFKEKLRKTLVHEVRHHNEYLAGYRDLEVYDEQKLRAYYESKSKKNRKD